jgi:hypothetical protein
MAIRKLQGGVPAGTSCEFYFQLVTFVDLFI